jgi:hypothetical protein
MFVLDLENLSLGPKGGETCTVVTHGVWAWLRTLVNSAGNITCFDSM